MDKFEEQLKSEFDGLCFPENNMYDRVSERLNEIKPHNKGIFRKIAACTLICITLLAGTVTIYAQINDISLTKIIQSIWGTADEPQTYEMISCRARTINEKNSIKNLSIKPVRIIGDSRGIYVVLQIKGDNLNESFSDYDLDYSGGGNASVEMYEIESDEEERYIALEYIGDNMQETVADAGVITINLSGYGKESGSYHSVISYKYTHEEKLLQFGIGKMYISSLTAMFETNDKNEYERYINEDLCVIIDKEKVGLKFCYGAESGDNGYRIVYSLEKPVYPDKVTVVERRGDND